jgi:hypothetical protein
MAQHISGEIFIDRPVEAVFDEVADIRNEPTYNPNMLSVEIITGIPIGRGTQFSVVVKSRNDTEEMQITYTDFERPQYIGSLSVSDNMQVNGGLKFSPANSGTLLEWNWDIQLIGKLKLFSPLVSFMGNKQENRIWQGLKEKLESTKVNS